MNSLESIEYLYKPYKITLKNHIYLIESSSGKYILKKQNKDLFVLNSYLFKRGIDCYPELERNFNENENLIEFVNPIDIPKEQLISEMGKSLGILHNKTLYEKSISTDDVKEIKDNIQNNVIYLNSKYKETIKKILLKSFYSSKEYFFIRNYYKIQEALDFCKNEIDEWYLLYKDKKEMKISLIHNNLSLDHFIVSKNKNVFISWDNYRFDIPMIDIVHLYKTDNIYKEFNVFLSSYFKEIDYSDEDKKLLFILLTIPDYINTDDSLDIMKVKFNKLFELESIMRPYYSKNQKE